MTREFARLGLGHVFAPVCRSGCAFQSLRPAQNTLPAAVPRELQPYLPRQCRCFAAHRTRVTNCKTITAL